MFAQTPDAFKYQAVARDGDGNVKANEEVTLTINIRQGSVDGQIIYSESHNKTTNSYGLVNLTIGEGNSSDDFASIDWPNGPYFIEVRLNGKVMGTSQLLSVPYAKYADNTGIADSAKTSQKSDTSEVAKSLLMEGDDGRKYQLKIDSSGNVYAESQNITGWKYEDFDLKGSKYYQTDHIVAQGNISKKWEKNISYETWPRYKVLTGDVNNDGMLEVVTALREILYVFDNNGNEILSKNIGNVPGFLKCFVSMVEDVNDDGVPDIGVGYKTNDSNPLKVKIFDGEGNVLHEFSKNTSTKAFMTPLTVLNNDLLIGQDCGYDRDPRGFSRWSISQKNEKWYFDVGANVGFWSSIVDANEDGDLEMLHNNRSVHNGATGNGTTDGDCYTIMIDEHGNKEFIQKYDKGDPNGSIKDRFIRFDPNSAYRIVTFKNYESAYPGTSRIHIRDLTGNYLYTKSGLNNGNWSSAWADMDDDGKKEIVTSNYTNSESKIYVFDETLNAQNSLSLPSKYRVNAITDLDGDNEKEIIISSENNIKSLDANLNEEFSWNTNSGEKIQRNRVIVSDTESDGMVEIIGLTDQRVIVLEGE